MRESIYQNHQPSYIWFVRYETIEGQGVHEIKITYKVARYSADVLDHFCNYMFRVRGQVAMRFKALTY